MARLCQPEKIVWLNGSEREKRKLEKIATDSGTFIPLNPKKHPHSFYSRSKPNDVARTEHLTYMCSKTKEDAGPTNNWMRPKEGYKKASKIFKGSMKGRTMYVIPFSMGLPNSPFAKIGIQLTDSVYVALNMGIMTHMGNKALTRLGTKGEFTKCLHSLADLDITRRLILHFPEDNAIWSVGSGYGGNALLGKKCMALRIASNLGHKEGWMAEHMLIMGIEDPHGRITYVAAAFPSACGKTNLAMLVPPPEYLKKGYKIWTLGDDIAWLRIDDEGFLRAMNPEAGMFGVVPGTNSKTNPNAMAAMRKNTIFTNVLLKKDKTVWWEGHDEKPPKSGFNWRGNIWKPNQKDLKGYPINGAHPNSRFTAPIEQCPSFSKKYYDPQGVKISAIIFGGRCAHLTPLIYEARSWQHGVYMGATVVSERTAAQMGNLGEVRRDPMAMIPFCGYNMGNYFQHWLDMGKKLTRPPRIFHVNWFRRNRKGKFIWPGFGENMRILDWILKRTQYNFHAKETPIGYIPHKQDINLKGLKISNKDWVQLFDLSQSEWVDELENQKTFFKKFNGTIPKALWQEQRRLRNNLGL